jgi:hypothetical protein
MLAKPERNHRDEATSRVFELVAEAKRAAGQPFREGNMNNPTDLGGEDGR